MRGRRDINIKKVYPMEISNHSITNISQNQGIENSNPFICRFCKETLEITTQEYQLIFPCNCMKPIHKSCLQDEMKDKLAGKVKHGSLSRKQKRYNCSKCAEVIRFKSQQILKCRSFKEILDFSKQNCCMCISLSVATFVMCGMLLFLIILTTSKYQLQNKTLLDASVIGFSIAIAVILIIVIYFFISEVLIKITLKVEIINNKDVIKKQKQKISIQDCS